MRSHNNLLILASLIAFLLTSCGQDNYRLFVVFDNVEGLTTESPVTVYGLKVGVVDNLALYRNTILVTLSIDKNAQIPTGSGFIIDDVDLMETKSINILVDSTSTRFLADKDTVYGQTRKSDSGNLRLSSLDSVALKNLKPFVDTLANAIRDLGKSVTESKVK